MPNYVLNSFMKIGQPSKFDKLTKNANGDFDFNVICPMPKELAIVSEGMDLVCEKEYKKYVDMARDVDDYIKIINLELNLSIPIVKDQEEIINMSIPFEEKKQIRSVYATWNYLKYGSVGWYDWRTKNWGTKWNACDSSESEFQTAWCAPGAWLEKLTKHCDFILTYADEDIGSNCGIFVAKDGKLKNYYSNEITDESTIFAMTLQGYDEEYADGFDSEETREHFGEMFKNKKELLKNFFVQIGCEHLYDEIGKDLESLW